jgi:hypothetical protein
MDSKVGEKLDSFTPRLKPGPAAKYPYDTWFDGSHYRLVQGKQFSIKIESMTELIRQQAKARGLEVSVYGDGPDAIVVICHNNRPAEPSRPRSARRVG